MRIGNLVSRNGVQLRCASSSDGETKPWLILILPFGLKVEFAEAFFRRFETTYRIVSWESRLIFSAPDRELDDADFGIENHVADLLAIIEAYGIERADLVGYCSGAGIALAAVKSYPHYFDSLVLVHGEYAMLDDEGCVTQIGKDIDNILPFAAQGQDKAQFVLDRISSLPQGETDDISGHEDINLPYKHCEHLHRYARSYLVYRAVDFTELARTVDKSTIAMTGHADQHTNVASSARISDLIRNSRLFVDDDSDHYGVLRRDSNTLQQIRQFLDEQRNN